MVEIGKGGVGGGFVAKIAENKLLERRRETNNTKKEQKKKNNVNKYDYIFVCMSLGNISPFNIYKKNCLSQTIYFIFFDQMCERFKNKFSLILLATQSPL